MKQYIKEILDELAAELDPLDEELEDSQEQYEEEMRTWEEEQAWHAEMKRLVIAGLAGDSEAWDIWSDMWKDEYGCRPRYFIERIRWMYGLNREEG